MKFVYCISLLLIISACFQKKFVHENDIKLDEVLVTNDFQNKGNVTNDLNTEITSKNTEKKQDLIRNYKGSNTLYFDLIHTKLDLKFDYKKKHVIGKADITLKPYYYATDSLFLDAKNFDIHSIKLIMNDKTKDLDFNYDNSIIKIKLDKKYTSKEVFIISIDYKAKPDEIKPNGSWAIRSNRGLYFINPESESPQIWTQGETQSNSCWFPTIDSPNQNMSQEIFLTVDQEFKTLSNGLLVSSLANIDGTRTDYWKQDKPHAPYLTMIAIGKFEIIEDYWRDLPVFVYVEKKDIPKAKALFAKTYKMIEFYSEKLNYDFPWDKYSQIVVKNFVSGAMENTGAVVFGNYVLNYTNEKERILYECVVAHELSHHWFGDLVTCESWANLPLNESFATYFEYLWLEYEYDRYIADAHLAKDYLDYTFERNFKDENLIRFYNTHRDNMFDAHSYQKGGLILHMLRYITGDQAFWDALSLYLKKNEYQPVEIHHLRLAFEEVTGQDLNWFFNQWFLDKGIPEFDISYTYDISKKTANLSIEQVQNLNKFPLYKIPTFVDIYYKDQVLRKKILLDEKKEFFEFDSDEKPLFMNFDPENSILCKKKELYSTEEYIEILDKAPLYEDKNSAFIKLKEIKDSRLTDVYLKLAKHPYWKFRFNAISYILIDKTDERYNKFLQILENISTKDEDLQVRNLAKSKLDIIKKNNTD